MINRLSDVTHKLAETAKSGKWGRELSDMEISIDGIPGINGFQNEMKAALGIRMVAQNAPIRILPFEKIVGSATMRQSAMHRIPVFLTGKAAFGSISHVTAGFADALGKGYAEIREEAESSLRLHAGDAYGESFLNAVLICLEAAGIWHKRHMDELDLRIIDSAGAVRENYIKVRSALRNVPERPPEDFHEALMSLWFMFSFQRLCGNWPGIGRIDEMLGPYLKNDLERGVIDLDEARELIAHFWIKGCDWIGASELRGSGDAQHYQNIVLSGINKCGDDITNEVTYLILDAVEELLISDFPIAVRISAGTPDRLLRRIAEVQKRGGGIIAVYNEKRIINNLVSFGYGLAEACGFANDGCWEIQIPGRTYFMYTAFDAYGLLQKTLHLNDEAEPEEYPDFDGLFDAYVSELGAYIASFHEQADRFGNSSYNPSASLAFLIDDCIGRAKGYYCRGPVYTVLSPHAGGIPDAANSLSAIKRVVYDEKRMTLRDFIGVLKQDWEGNEDLRQYVLNEMEFFGNDNPEYDRMAHDVLHAFIDAVDSVKERAGVLRPAGVSTFGREIAWAAERQASAAGRKKGSVLAGNLSPSPNTDRKGPTAVIRSHCALDLTGLANGTALDLKILPMNVRGTEGTDALVSLMRTFIDLSGIFMQIDVSDNEILKKAQANPEEYTNLAVRVSGWSARFVTLDREWQDMIINRTSQSI